MNDSLRVDFYGPKGEPRFTGLDLNAKAIPILPPQGGPRATGLDLNAKAIPILPPQGGPRATGLDLNYNPVPILPPQVEIPKPNIEYPKSVKFDIFDPASGRTGLIEENLRNACKRLNRSNCSFSVGFVQTKMYYDQIPDLVLVVNEKFALINKQRFNLDRPLSEPELQALCETLMKSLETACFYRF